VGGAKSAPPTPSGEAASSREEELAMSHQDGAEAATQGGPRDPDDGLAIALADYTFELL
jgi:hypothetical protein